MSIIIRDVREHELDLVLALNNAAGPGILPMDAGKLRFFWENADYFRVAEKDGHLAGSFASWKASCSDPNRTSYTSPSRLSAQDPWRRDLSFLPTVFSYGNN